MHELELTNLIKTFKNKTAVQDVNVRLGHGVYGLLGENGAGKTTLMRMVCGILKPTLGNILCDGVPISQMGGEYRRLLGYLPQDFGYYGDFSALRFLNYMAALKALPEEYARNRIDELFELVDLAGDKKNKLKTFSGGMLRRVGIAQALLNDPEILVLDEPTAGLDPFGKEQILNLIKYLKTHCSPTIVVISHDIDEITRFANRIVVFNDSRIVYDEPMQQLFKHSIQLQNMGLDIPRAVKIANALRDRGVDLGDDIVTAEDLMAAIVERYNQKHGTQIDKDSCVFDMYDFSQKWLTSEERAELEGIERPIKEEDKHTKKSKSKSIDEDKKLKKSKRGKE